MGGDHKCPVCAATFTRPQHVVRHMRSHTGDRPYKCQHCGDQFSRSDLLSRHVNKCHVAGSSSIAPDGSGTGRRKGLGPNATRATTSKQACDQCVQSSLPCDGCNPCAKCIQRKVRCTFVKFHRQTAPIGPGHNPARVPSSTLISATSFPAHSGDVSAPTFGGTYDGYEIPRGTGGFADDEALVLHPAPNNSISTSNTSLYNRRAQQQGDLHRRASLPSFPVASGSSLIAGWNGDSNGSNAGGVPFSGVDTGSHFAFDSAAVAGGNYTEQPFTLRHPHSDHPSQSSFNPQHPHTSSDSLQFPDLSSSSHHVYDDRAIHDNVSDISSSNPPSRPGTSDSFSSTRPGTSFGSHPAHPDDHGHENSNAGFSSAFGLMSLDDAAVLAGLASDGVEFFQHLSTQQQQGLQANRELGTNEMSLRNTGDPDATPMPIDEAASLGLIDSSTTTSSSSAQQQHELNRTRSNTGPGYGRNFNSHHGSGHNLYNPAEMGTPGSSGKDAEARELREFWKAYMQTPLSGPGSSPGMLSPLAAPSSINGNGYRRTRVSSLPSVKTPTAVNDEQRFGYGSGQVAGFGGFKGYNGAGGYGNVQGATGAYQLQPDHPHRGPVPANGGAHPHQPHMTTMHGNAEDLRSYEAAVLARARTIPVNLSMEGKRKNKPIRISAMGGNDSSGGRESAGRMLSAPTNVESTDETGTKPRRLSLTPESGSSSFASGDESSGSGEGSVSGNVAARRSSRPSYKRLASQVLEKGGSGKVARV